MAETDKALGLHQRIPMDILLEAFKAELKDDLDLERISELINTEYAGENRQKKGFNQVKTTLTDNALVVYCKGRKDEVISALQSPADRNLILSAVIAARYPFCYDLFCVLAKQFRLQDEVNKNLILRMIAAKYGANKSVYNVQINAVAQMLEACLITRAKVGVYMFAQPQKPAHSITYDVWRESYFINERLVNKEDAESVMFEPYFRYLKYE
mgnify:CR=1 FL=1|jgi:hypothetical protein